MLEQLRDQLSQVDMQLLELVAERQRLVTQIGAVKQESGSATRDYERERRVIDGARNKAESLGIDVDMAEALMRQLIEGSLTRQEHDRLRSTASGTDRSALVLGGCGKMGGWFSDFLSSQGFGVTIFDPSPAEAAYPRVSHWQAMVDEVDLIIVAAPIQTSAELLHELSVLRPKALIFDIASLKSPLRRSLRALADAGCRVCSVHPMFGPDTQMLSHRHVIFVDLGHSEAVDEARGLFESTMAQRVNMSLEDHDRLVAYVLGLSHVLNIAFFTALRESGEAARSLAELSSTTFDAQLQVAERVAGENPHMYFEIQSQNDYRSAPLNALADAVARLQRLIEERDERGFVRLMEEGHAYLQSRPRHEG